MSSLAAERVRRPAAGLRCAGLLALVWALVGCGSASDRGAPVGPQAGAGSTGSTASAAPSTRGAGSGVPTVFASACPPSGTVEVPDGTWAGALVVKVRSAAPETTARGTGTGELQLSVEGGKVTGGTWALTWRSTGPSTAHEAQSTVRLHGQVTGTVSGTGAHPVLDGAWKIVGGAAVTAPVTATASVDESGHSQAPLGVRTTGCEAVDGHASFSMTSPEPYAASEATLVWAGRRAG